MCFDSYFPYILLRRKVPSGPTSDDKITDAKKFETSESKEEER